MDIATAENKKGSLDFGSLPNLKANPLVWNVDGMGKKKNKTRKKYGNSAPSKWLIIFKLSTLGVQCTVINFWSQTRYLEADWFWNRFLTAKSERFVAI